MPSSFFLSSHILPHFHCKPLEEPTSLEHWKNTADERRSKDPDERYDNPSSEEAARKDVVGEEHGDGDLGALAGCWGRCV